MHIPFAKSMNGIRGFVVDWLAVFGFANISVIDISNIGCTSEKLTLNANISIL